MRSHNYDRSRKHQFKCSEEDKKAHPILGVTREETKAADCGTVSTSDLLVP